MRFSKEGFDLQTKSFKAITEKPSGDNQPVLFNIPVKNVGLYGMRGSKLSHY